MTDCLLCLADDIEQDDRVKVKYNSARSEESKIVEGNVENIVIHKDEKYIRFRRDDGQDMKITEDEELISYNSHFPVTGYWYELDVKHRNKVTA